MSGNKTFCIGCAQNMSLDGCYKILENCSLRVKCNKFDDLFGESSDRSTTNVVLLVSAVILFIFLLLKDGLKGLKIRAHWIPGDFLVLSALTIELLNLISTQGEPLNWERRLISLNEFWMIHTSRIMLCVVIAYLMPAMANPGAEDFWGKIVSLALTVFLHVISELYVINPDSATSILKALWPRQPGTPLRLYYIFAALIFSSFCLLLFLLACANIAGRGIERIIAKKVPLILKGQAEEDDQHQQHRSHEDAEEDHHPWQRVEVALLRAWIVARAYSLEYAVARSALASSSAIIVTFQITITIAAGVQHSPKLVLCNARDGLRFSVTMLQCVFILIGWSMILWRWVTAVAYYGSSNSHFRIEDFWTRHLRELQQAQKYELPLSQLLLAKIEKLVVNQSTKITLPRLLLYPVIWLQLFTVSLSKACLLVSHILFSNKLKDILLSSKLLELQNEDFKYHKLLKGVQMLGETLDSLWLSNRKSIKKAVFLVQRGKEHGAFECKHLVGFLASKRTGGRLGLNCLPQTGLNYLCKRTPIEGTQQPSEEELTGIGRKPWKMTAVSLLSIIAQLSLNCVQSDKERASTSGSHPPSVVQDCFEAYSQAWEIIDFVDMADTEADGITSEAAQEITSEAADMYFATLREKVTEPREATVPQKVTAAFTRLRMESKRKTETPASIKLDGLKSKDKRQGCPQRWNGSDSIDWNAVAVGSAVYKLCNSIQCNEETDVNDLLKDLESSLADIINECLEKIQHLLMLNCRKWAIKSDERKIAKALYTAGKASKIMEILKTKDKMVMEEGSGSSIVPYLS